MATATVITAFFPIQSKFPTAQYLEWAQRFLQLAAPIVLFTTEELASTFASLRVNQKPLHIITTSFEDLDMWKLYKHQWLTQHTLDHEAAYHTPELYALWAQKSVFVAEVVKTNPFGTDTFYWCDIGAFRDPNISPSILATFPQAALLRAQHPAILLNSVASLGADERLRRSDGIFGNFQHVNRIVGGLWGGTAHACIRWRAAFESQLIRYFTTPGRFAGKDQSVMLSAFLEDPSLAVIARPTTSQGDHWFFQEYLLSAEGAPFEPDASYMSLPPVAPPPPPKVTVKLMGGLGNQMFQIATAVAYARTHNAQLVLATEKAEPDGRPMYWETAFHRFQHLLHPPTQSFPFIKPAHWEEAATIWRPLPAPPSIGMRLNGYFQSPRYFQQHAEYVRALFRPSADVLTTIKERQGDMLEMRDRVVVVHARRGDYLKAAAHHGPLTADYYRRAMALAAEKVENPVFMLVSDDPMWWFQVMPELPLLQSHAFTILSEEDEVVTMALLQQFRHFIVANSSFSWWAAWMAAAPLVIAPARWFGPEGPKQWEDIDVPYWLRI